MLDLRSDMNDIMELFQKKRRIVIYGAGIVASGIYTALKNIYNCIPIAFLTSEMHGNPNEIDGIPVKHLSEWNVTERDIFYLVAVPEAHHIAIAELLYRKEIDSSQILFIDNYLENKIMGDFYTKSPLFKTAMQILEPTEPSIVVFQAKCHLDKKLQNKVIIPKYVCPIQVGAALTDQAILDRRDNEGDNISEKNGNYCELTASYYAWKHSHADYKGLCHYRRIFDINDEQMQELLERKGEWDVILPYPSVHYPDISRQHLRYIDETDWNAMIYAIKDNAVGYYGKIKQVFEQRFFYNFNMVIARSEVFDDYCSFLFSVLGQTEELTSPKGRERSDRFAGYLGENLTTFYFMANKDKLKILHSGKLWLT